MLRLISYAARVSSLRSRIRAAIPVLTRRLMKRDGRRAPRNHNLQHALCRWRPGFDGRRFILKQTSMAGLWIRPPRQLSAAGGNFRGKCSLMTITGMPPE